MLYIFTDVGSWEFTDSIFMMIPFKIPCHCLPSTIVFDCKDGKVPICSDWNENNNVNPSLIIPVCISIIRYDTGVNQDVFNIIRTEC